MGYVLLGALLLGILLFVIGWLVVVVNGFQRHPVTGLVALIPGLNILTLPSLWHRVSGWVITGFVGLLLAAGAWLGGADTHLYKQAQSLGMNVTPPPAEAEASTNAEASPQSVTHTIDIPAEARSKSAESAASQVATEPLTLPPAGTKPTEATNPPAQAATVTAAPQVAPTPTTPAPPIAPDKALPASALYHIVFKSIATNKLTDTEGKYVRIVQTDGSHHEGKVHTANAGEILLEERMNGGSVTRTIKLNDIREASVMSSKQGEE